MILAGDVGGTKTILGLFKPSPRGLRVHREETFRSREHASLEAIVAAFLRPKDRIRACAVGVAGPVVGGKSHVVNLRWPVDRRRLARKLGLPRAWVINDLEATAWGLRELPSRKLVNLTPGVRPRRGNAALIAAGTGLGMAILCWDGQRHHPCSSEGGHQEFGPRDDLEIDLMRFLRARHGRASIERAVSGPAITAIYQFLVESGRSRETKRMSRALAEAKDTNAAIASAALERSDRTAQKAIELLASLYGSAAGDLALVANAVGGIYVGGGIAPKILPVLRHGEFVRSFRSKGRLSAVVEKIPVRVVTEPRTALLGAAACALARESEPSNETKKRTNRRGRDATRRRP